MLLPTPAEPGFRSCGDNPDDAQAVADTRAQVAEQCDCASPKTHGAYLRCAADVTNQAVAAGALSKECAEVVMGCAGNSTCGTRGAVTCCEIDATGASTCSVKRSANTCTPPPGGSACFSNMSSCCDACVSGGCATTTTTTATTTTTLAGAACGNGVIEPPEQCDGQVFCTANCRLPIYACCDIAVDSGVCSRDLTPEPGPPFCLDGSTTHIGTHAAGGPACPAAGLGYGRPATTAEKFQPRRSQTARGL